MATPRMLFAALLAIAAILVPAGALAHFERPTAFPDPAKGSVPPYRTSGPSLVVCKPDSRARILRMPTGQARQRSLGLLPRCAHAHIQAAVDAAANGTRILVLPGKYLEEPSRALPDVDERCADLMVPALDIPNVQVPSYAHQLRCPNEQNLIAVMGDSDFDGLCDRKCNLQIEGTGAKPADVVIESNKRKTVVLRADRADGLVIRNFTVQYARHDNVYVVETNGFRIDRIVSRWAGGYGVLTFTTDHGLYDGVVAYGNGDSGVYPGSAPKGDCKRYGIEIRNVDSYGNLGGYSGTAGNSVWVHDSRFHDNVVGMITDSAVPGHPGMPQDCSKFERNEITSNNLNPYTKQRLEYCTSKPFPERNPRILCPQLLFPVGTGIIILGGNRNLVRRNWIADNWRFGVSLYWVPALARGENDPAKATDTSHGNRFLGNRMGLRRDGRSRPNGFDFQWDGEGTRNCWQGNRAAAGKRITGDPSALPRCPGSATFRPADPDKFGELLACINWNPRTIPFPKGCSWYVSPKKPR